MYLRRVERLTRPGFGLASAISAPPWAALLDAGVASLLAVKRLANALKESLGQFGPVLQLNSTSIGLLFPTAFERLDVLFYRYYMYTKLNRINNLTYSIMFDVMSVVLTLLDIILHRSGQK